MTTQTSDSSLAPGVHDAGHGMAHVVSPRLLLATFGALVGLTIVTVAMSTLGLGAWEIWGTLGIATLKASLVAMFFMHLLYDKPFHAAIVVFCLFFVFLLLGLTILDSHSYQPDVNAFLNRP